MSWKIESICIKKVPRKANLLENCYIQGLFYPQLKIIHITERGLELEKKAERAASVESVENVNRQLGENVAAFTQIRMQVSGLENTDQALRTQVDAGVGGNPQEGECRFIQLQLKNRF